MRYPFICCTFDTLGGLDWWDGDGCDPTGKSAWLYVCFMVQQKKIVTSHRNCSHSLRHLSSSTVLVNNLTLMMLIVPVVIVVLINTVCLFWIHGWSRDFRLMKTWTLSRPWCPQRRHAWRALLGGGGGLQSGSLLRRELTFCCIWTALMPQWLVCRRCR